MKYVGVADDIIYAKTREKVHADHLNVPLAFGDLGSIELDLASNTYVHIREMLKPIFDAHAIATAPDTPDEIPQRPAAEISPRSPGVELVTDKGVTIYVTRQTRHTDGPTYKAGCRAWAKKTGRTGEINKYYFPAGLLADFDSYLARNGG